MVNQDHVHISKLFEICGGPVGVNVMMLLCAFHTIHAQSFT